MKSIKPFEISKRVVWESYKRVKANRGAAGIDAQSIEVFEQDLSGNLYKLWNRMSSGSYFPAPVKRVEIPKASGGRRPLGIPTVADRIAQMVAKTYLEPQLDPIFHQDSHGYRPGRSALDAIAVTRKRCWQYDWVVEFDIKGAFDHIDHEMLMRALRHHGVEPWIELYVSRWLTVPFETPSGAREERDTGVPQGGVISPLLMNLFMHYAFDVWMQRTFPDCPIVRYADDAVVHCRTHGDAERVFSAIGTRLADCKLTMHPDKSSVVYCKDSNRRGRHERTQFTFLGFTFRARSAVNRQGKRFSSFLPAVSPAALKRMRTTIRTWRLPRQSPATLQELSNHYNPILRGWWQYYGTFYPTELRKLWNHLDLQLARWARRKYKRLAGHRRRSREWLRAVARAAPELFVHWRLAHAAG